MNCRSNKGGTAQLGSGNQQMACISCHYHDVAFAAPDMVEYEQLSNTVGFCPSSSLLRHKNDPLGPQIIWQQGYKLLATQLGGRPVGSDISFQVHQLD